MIQRILEYLYDLQLSPEELFERQRMRKALRYAVLCGGGIDTTNKWEIIS
jgi:hypothetical protein